MSKVKRKRFPIPCPGVLLVVALVLLVIAGGFSVWVPYHQEQAAIREIERLGGTVETALGRAAWLSKRGWVRDDWMAAFDRVDMVFLEGAPIGDDDLKHLSGMRNLELLFLDETQVSSDGVQYLSGLPNLKMLCLDCTRISDAGLKHLSGLTKLEELWVSGTQISDAGLKHLGGLTQLAVLHLEGTQVTNNGVVSLKQKLPDCEITW